MITYKDFTIDVIGTNVFISSNKSGGEFGLAVPKREGTNLIEVAKQTIDTIIKNKGN